MRRRAIVVVAACLAVAAGVLPLVAAFHLSRARAIEAERAHLAEYARWTLLRAELTLSRAKDALHRLSFERHVPCSAEHIDRMRRLAVDVLTVEEIGYVEGGQLRCSGGGRLDQGGAPQWGDEQRLDGSRLVFPPEWNARVSGKMFALRQGNHQALINQDRMIDVLRDSAMTLGIATQAGTLIALSGRADPALAMRLSREETSGTDDRQIYASVRAPGLIAFAIADRAQIATRVDSERWVLLPLGILVSAVLVGLVAWVSRQRLSLLGELQTAIRKNEFIVHYQPIIALSTGRCVGAEALIRWPRPDGSWIGPDLFVPFAEQHGLIGPLTDLVIGAVLRDLGGVLAADRALHVAINISADDIGSGRFLDVLERAIQATRVHPSQIWIEATERGFIDADAARRTIERAQALGHRVAIDDFGTGYSSLSLLEALPLNALKIDKSFIDAIGRDAATSVVTPHIIEMAHGLKFDIVAEGVETLEQQAYLAAAGVEFAQGWLYAKALPPDRFVAFCRARNADAVSAARANVEPLPVPAPV